MASSELAAALYALSGVVSLGVASWIWRRRDHRGARTFIGLLFVVAIWTFVDTAAALSGDAASQWLLWQTVRWSVIAFVPALWFLFTLRYTNLYADYFRPIAALLFAEATAVAVLTLTNGSHQLVWDLDAASQTGPAVATVGPVYVAHMFVTTWLVLGGIVLLLQVIVDARDAHRTQPAVLIAAGSIVLASSVGSAVGSIPIDDVNLTPLGLGLGSVVTAWALYRHRLFDIYPVESETVMTAIRDAVVVVNEDGFVTDYNPAGADLLVVDDPVGTAASEALPFDDSALDVVPSTAADGGAATSSASLPPTDALDGDAESAFGAGGGRDGTDGRTTTELTATVDGERRHFLLDVSRLSQHGDRTGSLLVFRDETTRREQRRELERQSEHMEQFASTVSHDLRNPLTVAESSLELLSRKSDHREAEMVEDSLERMRTIIDESLSFARSGQRLDDADLAAVDLDAAAQAGWDYVDAADATLTVDDDIAVVANEERLQRMLENLFRNAVDHGGADVTVRVGRIGDKSGFYVADDGPGIPDDHRADVFERGFTTDDDGTGFGLAIVDAIAGAHGWEISASESESGGARFDVTGCTVDPRSAADQPGPA
ncbi:Signal transduction histidine kinase [Natronoarchaeum philippinense]|uniref:histidine kinase n=1 Tax=Natronoarchaeum philippinense TaxID=558529 RepID=A0A285PCD9_NATPI|nr:histidine kinase N-terminal 7TM domain-containing protein [Natronoarchaeum philippinense]SNZ17796.1 Signal transduction histidine kinase [Natronoarchaeum philippinense]